MQITRVEGNTVFMLIPMSSTVQGEDTREVYARKEAFSSWYLSTPGTHYEHNNETGEIDVVEDSYKRKGSKKMNIGMLNRRRSKSEDVIFGNTIISEYNNTLFDIVGERHPNVFLPHVDYINTIDELTLAIKNCLDVTARIFITDQFNGNKSEELHYLEVLGGILTLYTAKRRLLKLEQTIK